VNQGNDGGKRAVGRWAHRPAGVQGAKGVVKILRLVTGSQTHNNAQGIVEQNDEQRKEKGNADFRKTAIGGTMMSQQKGQTGGEKQQNMAEIEADILKAQLRNILADEPNRNGNGNQPGDRAHIKGEILPEIAAGKINKGRQENQQRTHIVGGVDHGKAVPGVLRIDEGLEKMLKNIDQHQRKYNDFLGFYTAPAQKKKQPCHNSQGGADG